MRIRVLICVSVPVLGVGLRTALKLDGDIVVVGEAYDEDQAVAMSTKLEPDIVIIDAGLRPSGCIKLLKRLPRSATSGSRSDVNVMVFDASDAADAVEVIAAGASGLVRGDSAGPQFVLAVRMVAAGSAVIVPGMVARRIRWTSSDGYCGQAIDEVSDLTARENEVLLMVGRGLSNDEIARDLVIEEVTVLSHLHHTYSASSASATAVRRWPSCINWAC